MQVSCLFFDRLEACSAEQCSYSKTNSAEQASILGLLHEMGMKTDACSAGARKYSLKFPIPVTQILASAFKLMHASNCMILTFLNFAIPVICCHMKKKLCNSKCGFNFSYM